MTHSDLWKSPPTYSKKLIILAKHIKSIIIKIKYVYKQTNMHAHMHFGSCIPENFLTLYHFSFLTVY